MIPADTTAAGGSTLGEELSQDAHRLADTATDRARQEAETRKGQVTSTAHSASSALDRAAEELERDGQTPHWLSSAFRQTAGGIERLAGTVENRSPDQLAGDVSQFARQNPAAFLAASAAAGFAAARFFRAGAEYKHHEYNADRARSSAGGGYEGDDFTAATLSGTDASYGGSPGAGSATTGSSGYGTVGSPYDRTSGTGSATSPSIGMGTTGSGMAPGETASGTSGTGAGVGGTSGTGSTQGGYGQ